MVIDSKRLLQKGKLIQVRPHTRFVHFPQHTHNYIEVIYMCQGSTTHILNGSEVVLEEGESALPEPECGAGDPACRSGRYRREF